MDTKDKVFWVALGGGVLAGVALLRGHVHAAGEGDSAEDGDGGEPMDPEPQPEGSPPETRRPVDPEYPRFDEVDERTALARVIRSEAGTHTAAERLAVAWVVRNRARTRGVTIRRMVCWPRCGNQNKERPFSSRSAPTAADLELADTVLAAAPKDDPTRGAWDAFEPALQDELVAKKAAGYTKTAEEVRRDWLRGSDFYGRVGRWELFGPKRSLSRPKPTTAAKPSAPVTVAPAVATDPRLPKYGPHNV